MKRERPSQPPLSAQFAAAINQLIAAGEHHLVATLAASDLSQQWKLEGALEQLFGTLAETQCDHNPALILRDYNPRIKDVAARYTPHAHDPRYLLHRTVHGHHIKTNVRGDGAQRSDTGERMHRRRMDENRGLRKRKPKRNIPSRPFQKRVVKHPWPKRSLPKQSKR